MLLILIESKNILRQITDIQVQAERLIKRKGSLIEIEQFSSYSNEIKSYLLNNIKDEFILKYIHEIPDLNIDEIGQSPRYLNFLNLLGSGLGVYSREKVKIEKALTTIRDIRAKYASTEFMLKNYFN